MNVMSRFTIRSMKSNRKWTVVTLIGIILSTAMIAAVSTFCSSFLDTMRRETIADTGNWHARVFDVRVEDIPAFEKARFKPEISLGQDVGYAQLKNSKNQDKPYLFVEKFSDDSYKSMPVKLLEGRMPQNDGELVLPEHLKTNGGVEYHVGDTVSFQIGKRKSSDASNGGVLDQSVPYQSQSDQEKGESPYETFVPEQTRTYVVAGIMERPGFEPISAPGYTSITRLDKEALRPEDKVTVTLTAGRLSRSFFHDVGKIVKSIGLDDTHVKYNRELLRYSGIVANDSAQNAIYGFASIFLIIIMVASVSLIYNAFAISISERVSQLGMLASVGATKQQKRRSVYFEGFLLGVVGIPLGIFAGIAGIGITLSAIRPLLNSFSNFSSEAGLALHVSLPSIVAAAVLAALTIFVSVWVPARRASKIMPIDAIRQTKEVHLTRKSVKTSRLTHALFGFEGEIALKNLKRSRKKYRSTVISLTISLVLFLTVSYYAEALGRSGGYMQTGVNYDLMVSYSSAGQGIQQINQEIAALKDVKETTQMKETVGSYPIKDAKLSKLVHRVYDKDEIKDFRIKLACLDDESFDRYTAELGVDPGEYRDPEHPRMILINYGQTYVNGKRTGGELLDMKPGDFLHFSPEDEDLEDGSEGNHKVEMEIGLLTDQRPMGILISPLLEVEGVVSNTVFDSLPDEFKDLDSEGHISYQQLFLTCDKENADKVDAQIREKTQGFSSRAYIYNVATEAQSERNLLIVLRVFIYGFITLISLICIANIFNTVTTNIALRRHEFAMLRSVGMTPRSFNRMIRFESIFYGLKSLMFGLPISIGISFFLHRMEEDVYEVGFALPWKSYLAAIVLIFVIVGVTMLYSTSKVKKENIIDALKGDNL